MTVYRVDLANGEIVEIAAAPAAKSAVDELMEIWAPGSSLATDLTEEGSAG